MEGERRRGREAERREMVRRGRRRGLFFPLRNLSAWVSISQLVTRGLGTAASLHLPRVGAPLAARAHTPFSLCLPAGAGAWPGRWERTLRGAAWVLPHQSVWTHHLPVLVCAGETRSGGRVVLFLSIREESRWMRGGGPALL